MYRRRDSSRHACFHLALTRLLKHSSKTVPQFENWTSTHGGDEERSATVRSRTPQLTWRSPAHQWHHSTNKEPDTDLQNVAPLMYSTQQHTSVLSILPTESLRNTWRSWIFAHHNEIHFRHKVCALSVISLQETADIQPVKSCDCIAVIPSSLISPVCLRDCRHAL